MDLYRTLYLEVLHSYMSHAQQLISDAASQMKAFFGTFLQLFENPYGTYLISLTTVLLFLTLVVFMENKGY